MTIVLFSDTYYPEINGVAVSVENHYKTLTAHGHTVYVVTTNPFSKKVTFENHILRVPGIKLKKLYGYIMAPLYSRQAYNIIKTWSIDVIHLHSEYGIGIFGRTVAKKLKKPTVYTYHTMYEDYTYYLGIFKPIVDLFVKGLSRKYAMRATEFIAPSEKTKQKMLSYGAKRNMFVVPTGIDFSKFKASNLDPLKMKSIEEKYRVHERFTLLSLGRVAKEKSIDLVIRSFAQAVKATAQPMQLLIVGGGPAKNELEALAKSLHLENDITFVGPVPSTEVQYYYHAADLFVNASITETQGLTYMEAMAADTLVLARFDKNLADLIVDGKTGFLFQNETEFTEKLKHIVALSAIEKKVLIQQAKEKVDGYSIERFYDNLMQVYTSALQRKQKDTRR